MPPPSYPARGRLPLPLPLHLLLLLLLGLLLPQDAAAFLSPAPPLEGSRRRAAAAPGTRRRGLVCLDAQQRGDEGTCAKAGLSRRESLAWGGSLAGRSHTYDRPMIFRRFVSLNEDFGTVDLNPVLHTQHTQRRLGLLREPPAPRRRCGRPPPSCLRLRRPHGRTCGR